MNNTAIFNKKHHYRELLAIGIPVIIGQLGTIVLGFADTLMIGHHSTEELAAAGLVNNIFALVLISYMGFSYGLTPIIGRLYGMEHTDEIGQKVRNSFIANMMVGSIFTLAMIILYFNLNHIGQPEELLSLMRPYFIVNLISVLFVGVFNTMKQFLDGITHTKVAMWVMICGNVLNILGNWMLIYGVGPFPELGLLGAGLSTMGSRIFMAVVMVAVVVFGKKFQQYRHNIIHSSLNKADFREMNRLGWPLLSRAFGHGFGNGDSCEPLRRTKGLQGGTTECLRRLATQPDVLHLDGYPRASLPSSDRWTLHRQCGSTRVCGSAHHPDDGISVW